MFRGTEVPEEWEVFLQRSLLARFATLDRRGFPHVTPVWFVFEGGCFFVTTTRTASKYRHVMRDSRVGLVVDDGVMPYRAVVVRGRADVVDGGVGEVTRRIAARYWPGWGVEALTQQLMDEPRVLLKVTPQRVVAWTE